MIENLKRRCCVLNVFVTLVVSDHFRWVFFVVVVTEWRTTLERLTAAKTDTEFTEEKMGHGRELFFFCAMYLLRTVSQKDYKCD